MKTGYKVCDAMTQAPIVVHPEDTLKACANIMKNNHVGAVIVKDQGKLLGILTEQDIVRKAVAQGEDPEKSKVREVMEKGLRTIGPEEDIFDALMKMRDLNIRHLPVVDNSKMIGLLTLKDVLKIQPQLFELLVEKIEVREAERKPLASAKENEGICQLCGEYAEELTEIRGSMVCEKCKRDV